MDPNSLALLMGSAGAAAGPATYVEDVFQTWLYAGNSSTQTITNGVDLSGKGGLVWAKSRSDAYSHELVDTARGAGKSLRTNTTDFQGSLADITSFGSSGFGLGLNTGNANYTGSTYASWTFRKQAKFFDVVTYVGNATANRTVAHNLGSAPGVIIMKNITQASNWLVYHRSLGATKGLYLNLTNAEATDPSSRFWSNTEPTSTVFTVGNGDTYNSNSSGDTFVAYLFAHDAGGFGDTGNDSIIKCGSFTATGSDVTVDLGWEPQWLLVRSATNADPWYIYDSMRGLTANNSGTTGVYLQANSANAETTSASNAYIPQPTSTGFIAGNSLGWGSGTMIYIAIRRGPMKAPTDATKVFSANTYTGTSPTAQTVTTGFPIDLIINGLRTQSHSTDVVDRMRGRGAYLYTSSTSSELTSTSTQDLTNLDIQDGYKMGTLTNSDFNKNGENLVSWSFRRASGFFDVVAYTGTGSARTVSHNLGVAPELMIVKERSVSQHWGVYHKNLTSGGSAQRSGIYLSLTNGEFDVSTVWWNATAPTASVFSVATSNITNESSQTYIAYLFASCPGVSKVGSYTGTGTTLSVDCGFTAGARFVLIKRTDDTGAWYVWDTARGIVSGNDPYLLLNSTAAEVTNTDYIDPLNAGFQISSSAPAAINANGGTFIYLAVA